MQAPAMPNGGEPGGCSSQMVLPCLPRPMIATLAVAAAGNFLGGAAAVVGRSECAMADIRRCAAVLPSILMVGVLAAPAIVSIIEGFGAMDFCAIFNIIVLGS